MRWMSGGVLGSSKRGSGRLGEACHMKEGASNHLKYFFQNFPLEGGRNFSRRAHHFRV
jgi:hypothetical protein